MKNKAGQFKTSDTSDNCSQVRNVFHVFEYAMAEKTAYT